MSTAPKKQLTLFDSTCLIMGIIVGTGIFVFPPMVARGAGSWEWMFGLWIVGGVLSLFGALGYAELASAYPHEGGDYVYLSRAYGPWAGFLFGWIQLVVVRPADIGVMAFGFALYAQKLYDPLSGSNVPLTYVTYACGATLILTVINIVGVRQGKWTQNVLAVIKVIGLLAIVAVALFASQPETEAATFKGFPLSVAMVLVLFTFGGWNEMALVAGEVKNAERNILRALVLGIVAVTVVYLLVNGAYLYALGFNGFANSSAVATDTVSTIFPGIGANLISALVCISALGVINGQIFTGARNLVCDGGRPPAVPADGKMEPSDRDAARRPGRPGGDCRGPDRGAGSLFDTVMFAAPAVYMFYLGTSLAVVVLRYREPGVPRPFRIPGYPVVTLVFAAVCVLLIWNQFNYNPLFGAVCLGIMFWGLTVYRPRNWVLSWSATLVLFALWAVLAAPPEPKDPLPGCPFHPLFIAASSTDAKHLFIVAAVVSAAMCLLWHRPSPTRAAVSLGRRVASGVLLVVASVLPLAAFFAPASAAVIRTRGLSETPGTAPYAWPLALLCIVLWIVLGGLAFGLRLNREGETWGTGTEYRGPGSPHSVGNPPTTAAASPRYSIPLPRIACGGRSWYLDGSRPLAFRGE